MVTSVVSLGRGAPGSISGMGSVRGVTVIVTVTVGITVTVTVIVTVDTMITMTMTVTVGFMLIRTRGSHLSSVSKSRQSFN